MIISASRRTDIPGFYTEWFMKRIEAGYCTVVNPYNQKQVSCVSLLPEDVDVMVFWTKNAAPLLPHLPTLDDLGYRYYFQYTVNAYPPELEPNVPGLLQQVDTIARIVDRIGPQRIVWRYDPIVLSNVTTLDYHMHQFDTLLHHLASLTHHGVISIVDDYRKSGANFKRLEESGVVVKGVRHVTEVAPLLQHMVAAASTHGITLQSCAELFDLTPFGIGKGKCVDDEYIAEVFGLDVTQKKDKSQREECGCVLSKDIGVYDTCLHGCAYCYAGSLKSAQERCKNHFIDSPSLLGRFDVENPPSPKPPRELQTKLF